MFCTVLAFAFVLDDLQVFVFTFGDIITNSNKPTQSDISKPVDSALDNVNNCIIASFRLDSIHYGESKVRITPSFFTMFGITVVREGWFRYNFDLAAVP